MQSSYHWSNTHVVDAYPDTSEVPSPLPRPFTYDRRPRRVGVQLDSRCGPFPALGGGSNDDDDAIEKVLEVTSGASCHSKGGSREIDESQQQQQQAQEIRGDVFYSDARGLWYHPPRPAHRTAPPPSSPRARGAVAVPFTFTDPMKPPEASSNNKNYGERAASNSSGTIGILGGTAGASRDNGQRVTFRTLQAASPRAGSYGDNRDLMQGSMDGEGGAGCNSALQSKYRGSILSTYGTSVTVPQSRDALLSKQPTATREGSGASVAAAATAAAAALASRSCYNPEKGAAHERGKRRRQPFCWMCEVGCPEGPGAWRGAPRLYFSVSFSASQVQGYKNTNHQRISPHAVGFAGYDQKHQQQQQQEEEESVSGLTLCALCAASMAAVGPVEGGASAAALLQNAHKTPALQGRSYVFIDYLREYKMLLDVLADDVIAESLRRYRNGVCVGATSPSSHSSSSPPPPSSSSFLVVNRLTRLTELNPVSQVAVLEQMLQGLEEILKADKAASATGCLQDEMELSERRLLVDEVTRVERFWMRAKLALQHERQQDNEEKHQKSSVTTASVPAGLSALESSKLAGECVKSTQFDGIRNELRNAERFLSAGGGDGDATVASAFSHGNSHPTSRNEPTPHYPPASRSSTAENGNTRGKALTQDMIQASMWQSYRQEEEPQPSRSSSTYYPRLLSSSRSPASPVDAAACPQTVAAAGAPAVPSLAATKSFIASGAVSSSAVRLASSSTLAATTDAASLDDNLLIDYFAGRMSELPRRSAQLVQSPPYTSIESSQQPPYQKPTEYAPTSALSRYLASQMELEGPTSRPSGEGVGNSIVQLEAAIESERRRRLAAEDAVALAHSRIASLEKVTNDMTEQLLTQRLSLSVAAHLQRMESFLHSTTGLMQDYAIRKDLLFAEEMAALVRRAQRTVYGVPLKVFPTLQSRRGDAAGEEKKGDMTMNKSHGDGRGVAECTKVDDRASGFGVTKEGGKEKAQRPVAPSQSLRPLSEKAKFPFEGVEDSEEDEYEDFIVTNTRPYIRDAVLKTAGPWTEGFLSTPLC